MTELTRRTNRRIVNLNGWSGVCHECNSPQTYGGEITVIVVEETQDTFHAIPIDALTCGHCGEFVKTMKVYKSLDVTKELSKV